MNKDTEEILEFGKIRDIISGYCASGLGKSLAEQLKPLTDLNQIQHLLDICSEAKEIKVVSGGLPLDGLRDIRHLIRKAEVSGSVLEPGELLDIAYTARVTKNLKAFAEKTVERYPMIVKIIDTLSTFPHLEEAIASCIDPEGNILDTASPQLSRIRRQLVVVRDRVIGLLESILHSPQYQTAIQENVITLRNNRYVIPVKQNSRGSLQGVIQASSASGVTVFMEPAGAVELNNQLRELSDQETIEVRKILRELTDKVREAIPSFESTLEVLADLDLIEAKASLCVKLKTTKPELNGSGYIKLIQARHPLLQMRPGVQEFKSSRVQGTSRNVVPIDFHIGDRQTHRSVTTIVITGPNTGGKTVALKTIGLLTLMMQAGLHVPANEGSQMAVFKGIFADIGDEQSIEQNLSTFSSHITRIIKIVEQADSSSLVLLDELGAGTEPSEGAALGMAILDFLHSRGARTVATTHHDSLKAHAHSRDGMENASVTFDLKTLSPTYELRIGMPGSSNAIRIADRLGLPEEIVEVARDYLGPEALQVADLISTVEEMQRELEKQQHLAEEKTLSASKTQQEHERLLNQLKFKRREMEREAMREAFNIVQSARKLVEKTIADIREEKASSRSIQQARQTLIKARKEIETAMEPAPREEGIQPVPGELKVGDEVYVKSLRSRGTLISLPDDKDMVQVRVGAAKLNLPLSEIRLIQSSRVPEFKSSRERQKASNVINLQSSKRANIPISLILLGNRAEEALSKVDKYLDDAALAGLDSVSIVHGRGTGALREAVAQLLSDHPLVANFRLGNANEGGDGITVVELV